MKLMRVSNPDIFARWCTSLVKEVGVCVWISNFFVPQCDSLVTPASSSLTSTQVCRISCACCFIWFCQLLTGQLLYNILIGVKLTLNIGDKNWGYIYSGHCNTGSALTLQPWHWLCYSIQWKGPSVLCCKQHSWKEDSVCSPQHCRR